MKARQLTRPAVVAAAAFAAVVSIASPAAAGERRLQAESMTIVNTGCGDDGPAATQSGGTGQVVFLPGDGCQLSFSVPANRVIDKINFFITGQAAEMCGNFTASGARSGTSSTLCIDGTDPNETYQTVTFTTTGSASGTVTIEWNVTTGASYVNAYVDYVEHSDVEAEDGTLDLLCGDDGPMAVQEDGARTVVFYPGNNCAQTFLKPANGSPTSIEFKVTGASGTICGHFEFTGAYVGSSASRCGGSYGSASVSVSAGLGTTFTVTWKTDSGTPTYVNAYVDYLVF